VEVVAFVDEYLLSKLEDSAQHGWPDWAVLWRNRVWIIGGMFAAAYAYQNGCECCHRGPILDSPTSLTGLAALADRGYVGPADHEKTMIVGRLAYARAFLRAVVTTGLHEPTA
jgi:hypothetical protein